MSFVQDLEEDIEDIGVRFFNLIKQDDGIGLASDLLGKLAAFLVTYVAGSGADDLGDRVLLHVFGHINADQILVRAEHDLRKGLGQLCLSDTGGTQEEEGTDRAVRVLQAHTAAPDRSRHCFHGILLADHPLVEFFFKTKEACALPLCQAVHRNLCPNGYDGGNILFRNKRTALILGTAPPVVQVLYLLDEHILLPAEFSGFVKFPFHKSPGQF